MTWSCHAMMRFTSVSDVLGSSTGMKSSEPSSSVGMNSLPKPVRSVGRRCRVTARLTGAGQAEGDDARDGEQRCGEAEHGFAAGAAPSRARDRRAAAETRISQFSLSGLNGPRTSIVQNTGTAVTASSVAPIIAKVLV